MIATGEKETTQAIKEPPLKQLVLFDFDGTITTKDTLEEFMIFYHGKSKYYLGLAILSPILAGYLLKVLPNWKSKTYFLKYFLKGKSAADFDEKCREFSKQRLKALIRPKAVEAIKGYQQAGATVAVVSASAMNWVKPWCDEMGIVCLATRLEVKHDRITGNFEGKNCHGAEKVCRIKENFSLEHYDKIIAYGDTSGDKEMLALAQEKFYKPFREA